MLRSTASTRSRRTVLFVGRITRQKGLVHLLDAALEIAPGAQLVLCAGAPDAPEIARRRERAANVRERAQQCRLDRGDAARSTR